MNDIELFFDGMSDWWFVLLAMFLFLVFSFKYAKKIIKEHKNILGE